jgi:hypothetical protein
MQHDVETLLARLFVEGDLREQFLQNPRAIASRCGLSQEECSEVDAVSASALETAARSYERKRTFKRNHAKGLGLKGWFRNVTGAVFHRLRS